ncbi:MULTISPECIES: lipopolysaccharide core heptose(I) kinase RfaP [Providencia]|uniref:lipopolysaccharide core heptose(I) kinase RfaP n=1 Tax=Providencia TaxID=586 RepID=UPI001BD4EC37|nr:lipopolysaccharide core heptose(I) kinase RfaP [Providencia rettgeri]ELR5070533.1 lipopolysaccharide core heptose(I) kinase RfaP [Providencia rettgeri]ELR5223655.1 lipopolysaccharide core heptose(I) kinase RfaP [Providencia rettgeri]MDX7323892.1 lipopolysaccharide core heptose(I) kinase RfaP [Providencia rettgeri]
MIKCKSPFDQLWEGKNPFYEVNRITGEVYRQVKNRRTLQFYVGNESFFIKQHYGITISEILKNILSFRFPVLDARQEWDAIKHLEKNNIDTMNAYAVGVRGINPLTRESFLITKDLNPTISLEDYCKKWLVNPPTFQEKFNLILKLASIVSAMHASGLNHRDCYLCHFLLDENTDQISTDIKMYIIDLHRAQIRSQVPKRWRDKDLIGLYFSSMNIGLTSRDIYRFLIKYFNTDLKSIFRSHNKLLKKARRNALIIKERTERKGL